MEREKHDRPGWRDRVRGFGQAAVPYWFAVSGLALGVGAIVKDEPVAGACGAVAGVAAGCLQQWRARFHRDHVDALRERLRTQRLEAEEVAVRLRQTVSSLQTELWQHRIVALATPAFGLQLSAIMELSAEAPDESPAALTPPAGTPTVRPDPEPFAQAS